VKPILRTAIASAFMFIILFASGPAVSGGEEGPSEEAEAVDAIQKKYESIKNFSADFIQETYQVSYDRIRSFSGRVYMAKPGKMLWIYEGDNPQQIVSNGSTLWYYQPRDKTVMTGELKGALGSTVPFDFLSGMGNITREFSMIKPEKPEPLKPGQMGITLVPHNPLPNVAEIGMIVDLKTYLLDKIIIKDHFGNKTSLFLKNRKLDQDLSDEMFEFKIPEGVEVITP
jgi:outer membrane lipoprotein carrier protein